MTYMEIFYIVYILCTTHVKQRNFPISRDTSLLYCALKFLTLLVQKLGKKVNIEKGKRWMHCLTTRNK